MLQETIRKLVDEQDLSLVEAKNAFLELFKEDTKKEGIAAFLLTLQQKSPKPEEIAGCALALQEIIIPIKPLRSGILNVTTLDLKNSGIFNVDIATAFVVAGCGIPIAQNYLNPSHTISKNVKILKELNINLKLSPAQTEKCINDIGIGFLDILKFIPNSEELENALFSIKTETIFDILSVLVSPAQARFHLIGCTDPDLPLLIGKTCALLDIKRAMIVRGEDNIDAITTCESTKICEYNKGEVSTYFISPRDFGMEKSKRADLICDHGQSAEIITAILTDKGGKFTEIVLLNSAAALVVCGLADSWKSGLDKARKSLKQGRALSKFKNVQNWTRNCKEQ